jgi:hypothetical protein
MLGICLPRIQSGWACHHEEGGGGHRDEADHGEEDDGDGRGPPRSQ